MDIHEDVHLAKKSLRRHLFRSAIRRGVNSHMMAMTVESAVSNAAAHAHGLGIGLKVVEGGVTDQICVRVHVNQKISESLIPPQHVIPKEIGGIPTDIVESPPTFLMLPSAATPPNPKTRQRPIAGGLSAAQFEVTAGTLSCFCRSTRDGDDADVRFALSNNHVFANLNKAEPGDDVLQQSPLDGGTTTDTVGTLSRYVPLKFGHSEVNNVDAAIAAIHPDVEVNYDVVNVGPVTGSVAGALNMGVCKSGRTSGYSEGIITDLAYDAVVGMDHNDPNVRAEFHDQMRIQVSQPYGAIGLGGDSGSLIMQREGGKAVGLYFAGPQSGAYGIANPIDAVLNELEIELL